ncbi:hypothetical protein QEZ40_004762 [Streptomyces katrae]|uniref:Secreted protein n=1 Tax=Streptomyces katrae TaxID=68223 RepID=A0ABT7H0D2_9ACTN|nr:hypothetical protein [Streptomyces katrae]MDK9499342.1 hypothetical protein [Streptomyces katrae]
MTEPQAAPAGEPQAAPAGEPQAEPQTAPAAEPQTAPVAGAAAPAVPAPRADRRRRGPLIAGGVAVVLLAGGGVGASYALAGADRTAPTAYWAAAGRELPEAGNPAPVPPNDLSGKLLPMPPEFKLGPDLAGDGNDFFVSGEKAVEGFKEARKGLSSSERKKRDDMLADLRLKGLAGRSYAATSGGMVVEIRIMQADPKALGAFSEVSKKLLELGGGDRDAPKVDGYPDAKCALLPVGEEKDPQIDSMYCVAVQGDVLVSLRAYGPKKEGFSKLEATGFLKNQLSRLKSPGESV